MFIRTSIAVAAMTFVLVARPAAALDEKARITQYRHTAWRVQEGAFESAPNVITQTPDGYIWIGTDSGLVKYDGVRFVRWTPPAGKSLSSSAIVSLLVSSDGTLWIGTAAGLLSWKNDNLQEHVSGRIGVILEDHKHRIWVARPRPPDLNGGVCQVVGEHPGCIGGDGRMRLLTAAALSEDMEGNLWIGAPKQLIRWRDGSFETYFRAQFEERDQFSSVESIVAAGDGSLWAAIPREDFGVVQIVNGLPRRAVFRGINTARVTSLFIDRARSLWMGTSNDGVYRVSGERVDQFRSEDGLSSNTVRSFFEDREGNLWLATSKGLDCFRDSPVVTFSMSEGLGAGVVTSVLASDDGTLWVGNRGVLDVIRGHDVFSIRVPGHSVTALGQDHARRLWVGIESALTVYENGQFREIGGLDGKPLGTPIAIAEDREQNVWVSVAGVDVKLFRIRDLRVQDEFATDRIPLVRRLAADPTGGIWLGFENGNLGHYHNGKLEIFPLPVPSAGVPIDADRSWATIFPLPGRLVGLTVDADGSVWAATPRGIVHWKNGEMKTLSSRNGLPCDGIFGAIRDNHATLWINTQCGLIAIADSELERWWQQPDRMVTIRLLDAFDGAIPGASTLQPPVAKSPDGRLWFANGAALQMLDPGGLRTNRIPPPVYVEEVRADRKDYAIGGLVRLPARSRDIEIGYTALSFSIPQKVRFRYKLEGRDQEWHDAGTRRRVFYSDLPPGQYRFHVTASNNDGVWNDSGAVLELAIMPAYYQTMWFRAAAVVAALALLWALYQIRLRQLAHGFDTRLQERVHERTRIARELHDTLLQSLHGLMFRFQAVRNMLPGRTEEAIQTLDGAILRTELAIAESRDAIQDLRSESTGLRDLGRALATFGKELAGPETHQDAPIFRVTVEGEPHRLSPILHDEICRIARELVRNAFRHARAHRIEAEIRYEDSLFCLRIRDDGTGIDPKILQDGERAGHWGLRGIRERARRIGARLDLWSEAGAGTEAQLQVPAAIAYEPSRARPRLKLF
jgi:signal transduction histidine kinase/ligand-binding sensor domain-containing protein